MTRTIALAIVGLLGVAHADDGLRLRAESALGFDSNITRTEGSDRLAGPLARAVLDVSQAARLDRVNMAITYQGGARKFMDAETEDGLFQRLIGQVMAAVARRVVVGVAAQAQNRTTRDPIQPRDYTRLGGGPTVALRLDQVRLSLSGQVGRLVFQPDPDFSASSVGGSAGLRWRRKAWQVDGRVGLAERQFEGRRRIFAGRSNEGDLSRLGDGPRVDAVLTGGVGVRYQGDVLARLSYSGVRNTSNSYRAGFVRHLVSGAVTTAIPLDCVLSARLDLQQVIYDDPQALSLGTFIEDENRSSVALRLERPLVGEFSLVAHLGGWFNAFGSGPEYSRYTTLLGVAANIDQ